MGPPLAPAALVPPCPPPLTPRPRPSGIRDGRKHCQLGQLGSPSLRPETPVKAAAAQVAFGDQIRLKNAEAGKKPPWVLWMALKRSKGAA